MSDTGPVRVAAVGLGWVSVNRHIPALRRSKEGRLVGVIDHVPNRAANVARALRLPLSATAEHASDVEWIERIDAVTIGTPPHTHYALARSYLEAGKHVLVEKPMAMTVVEAEELAAIAADRGRILAVVHNFQFTRTVRCAAAMIDAGHLGEIRAIWAVQLSNPRRRLPIWYEQLPLGLFYDESPHFFYLIRSLVRSEPEFKVITVTPDRAGASTPAKISAQLESNGLPIQIDMNFQSPLSEWHIGVLGTQRAAFLDIFRDILIVVPNDGSHLGRNILQTSLTAGWAHLVGTLRSGSLAVAGRLEYGNSEVVRRFCAACLGQPEALRGISPADGIAVVRMQHEVLASSP